MKKNKILRTALSLTLALSLSLGGASVAFAGSTAQTAVTAKTATEAQAYNGPMAAEDEGDEIATLLTSTTKASSAKTVNLTSKQILKKLKKSLGKSYTSDTAIEKKYLQDYYGLNMKKVVNWAAESSSNSALESDCAIILKVKKGYAKTAAKKLQEGYEQVLSYNRMYDMDLQRVLQARLYINGNYVALIIEGKQADDSLSAEEQAKYAKSQAKKVDKAWKKIFGSAKNKITIPKDSGNNNFFEITEDEAV